eukprot:jgi/Chlat1/9232/Chrsp99S08509
MSLRASFAGSPSSSLSGGGGGGGGRQSGRDDIRVVVNGAAGRMGSAAVRAISAARGLTLHAAVDLRRVGEDVGVVAGLREPLDLPIINDIIIALNSAAQGRRDAVMVDFTQPSAVYENVRQAVAFGVRPVVGTTGLPDDELSALSEFCDKASTGCVVAPSFSIGLALLQQASASAAFHYGHIDIIESSPNIDNSSGVAPAVVKTADGLSGLGKIFNMGSSGDQSASRGQEIGDGVRVHSMRHPGLLASQEVRFGAPGEMYTIRHDAFSPEAYMPGLLLAIRRVVRLKSLMYGIERLL